MGVPLVGRTTARWSIRATPSAWLTMPLEVVVSEEYGGFGAPQYRRKYAKAAVTVTSGRPWMDRFAAGSPPDVVLNTGDKALVVSRLVAENRPADLQQVLDAPSWEDEGSPVKDTVLPGMLDAGRYEGTLRSICCVATVYGFWYSARLFQKYGWEVPRSWPDLLALGAEMKAKGLPAFTYAGTHPYYVLEPLLTLAAKTGGQDVLKRIDNLEDGAWQDESVSRALKAFGELSKRGLLLKNTAKLDHLGSQTQLLTSKVGLLPCGNWLENEMKAVIQPDFGLTMVGIPPLDASPALPKALHVAPTAPLLVSEQAKNKPGGLEYLRALLSKDVAAQVTAESNQLT
ncbi:hypothetical protein GCM10009789_08690 [Kribbella sancticallisti]|uniref:N-acetylglucosamine transport system substrate-binding protein n=1 Tax=Kribbella sancticallisti TaxID=460087 RepID=A0ABN2CF16_9ACTN